MEINYERTLGEELVFDCYTAPEKILPLTTMLQEFCHTVHLQNELREIISKLPAYMRISRAEAYEQMHSEGFPLIRIGKRMLAPRGKFLEWVEDQVGR